MDAFEPAIRRLLAVTPDMPATVVAERIGWTRGITVLRERVAELRPAYQVPEAFGRTEYQPRRAVPVGPVVPRLRDPGRPRPDGGAAGARRGALLLALDPRPA